MSRCNGCVVCVCNNTTETNTLVAVQLPLKNRTEEGIEPGTKLTRQTDMTRTDAQTAPSAKID